MSELNKVEEKKVEVKPTAPIAPVAKPTAPPKKYGTISGSLIAAGIGRGTAFSYSTNLTTPSYTVIARVTDFKSPVFTAEPIDLFRFDAATFFPDLVAGWGKAGEGELEIVYDPSVSTTILGLINTLILMKIVYPSGDGWTYTGMITSFGDEVPLKKEMSVKFKFKVQGLPTAIAH